MPIRKNNVDKKREMCMEHGTLDNDKTNDDLMSKSSIPDSISQSKYISALGLDVGSKRIGVAGCDRTGLIATGLTTIERTRFEEDVEQLRELINQREVSVLVVGLPYNMDGSLGFQAKHVQKFANRIAKILQLPIEYIDERLTSYQAEQMLISENRSPSRNKGLIDRKAAALILQQWLDARRVNK
jgi:putative holliday junction resolvase